MAIPSLSGSYIDETYQRLVQVSGSEYADGLGNPISFGGGPGGAINTIQINRDGTNFTGSANLTFVNNNIQLTGSLLVTQSYISTVDYIDFTYNIDQPTAIGRLGWNNSDGTLSLGLKGGNVDLLIGEAEVAYVVNDEATTLNKGEVVYLSGAQGNRIAVKRAFATSDASSAGTLGFVAETITAGGEGFVITRGVLRKVNTSGQPAGALLYLSSSAGQYTTVKPQAPVHEVRLGYIERVGNSNQGSIYVKVDNGYEIDELHDVKIISGSTGQLLVRSGSLWINTYQLTGSYELTGSLQATSFTGSLQGTASWASNYAETDPIFTAKSASLATTGSNNFIGNQTITGSLTVSGSSTFTNIGPAIFSGSVTSIAGFTGSFSGSVFGYVPNEATNSFITNQQTASFATTESFNSFTSSINSFTQSINNWTGSVITNEDTASMLSPYALSTQLNSYLTTGSTGQNQTIVGSLTINQNLTVLGSQSVQYVTSSQLDISTNIITLNVANPAVRFGGIAVIDSGSSPLGSGSFLYDSVQDEFIFVHKGSGTVVTSSHFLVGPETYDKLGDEIYITANQLLKSRGNEHVTGSNISDTGTLISINSNTEITGGLNVSTGITGSLQGTASWATNVVSASGLNNQIQYNKSGLLTGNSNLTFDDTTGQLIITPASGSVNTSPFFVQTTSGDGIVIGNIRLGEGVFSPNGDQVIATYDIVNSIFNYSDGNYNFNVQNSIHSFTGSLNVSNGITGSFSGSVVGYVPNEATNSFITNQQTASFTTTSSFNEFTSSINSFTQSILSWTGSVITNTQTSSMYVYSSSFTTTASYIDPQFISASAAAAGFGNGTTISTGSLLVSAEIVGGDSASNQILFTKGDTSTFTITVNTGSAEQGSGLTYSQVQRLIALGM